MYKLSVVGDAHARPDELARQVANLFELDFQLLQSVLRTSPQHHTLIDIDLNDEDQLLPLKNWLTRKPKDVKIIFAGAGLNLELAPFDRAHSIGGIEDQIEYHLLQLHGVADYRGKLLIELRLDPYAFFLHVETHQRQHGIDQIVQIDRNFRVGIFFEHRTDADDNIACALTGAHNIGKDALNFVHVGLFGLDPAQGRARLQHDPGKRLIDLVRN